MTITTKPTPAQVRSFLAERQQQKTPPPSLEEIRRMLGWNLIPANVGVR